jgi:two-component system sensor histidine kinase/response regulator
VNLPDMNGFEVCRILRSNPETAFITIVHISASSVLSQHQVRGLDAGADGYIVEPVEPEVLLATVNAFIRTRRAEEASRQANEALRWFAYRVGHDLNEPLRTIAVYSEVLKKRLKDLDVESSSYLEFIGEATIKMRALMDGLLRYAEATATESKLSEIDCDLMLDGILANLGGMIQASNARVTHDPLPVVRARPELEHVFQNLITNAIKYVRPGVKPEVHISATQQGNAITFSVQDNGVGIEPEYYQRVFEIFKRLHGNDFPGSGIGLALSQKIVEAHGGTIRVTSEPGLGSTFFFTLPGQNEAK